MPMVLAQTQQRFTVKPMPVYVAGNGSNEVTDYLWLLLYSTQSAKFLCKQLLSQALPTMVKHFAIHTIYIGTSYFFSTAYIILT